MHTIIVTRPDGSRIVINADAILSIAEAPPADSPLAGPPAARTRITFINQTHQDVRELLDDVLRLVGPRNEPPS